MKDLRITRPLQVVDDPEYLVGKAKNVTTTGDGTGTPWIADVINDQILGVNSAVLAEAGMTPNGLDEKAGQSQIVAAIKKISENVTRDITASYCTLVEAQALDLEVGDKVVLTDYANALYEVVADSDAGGFYLTYKTGFKFKRAANGSFEFPFLNVKTFGAKMDGSDDTNGFVAALEEAKKGGTVLVPQGVLNISPTLLPAELKGLYCIGIIKCDGTSGTDGALYGDGLINCKLRLNMDMANGDRAAIKLTNSVDNQFVGGKIYGFTNHPTLNHYGIWLNHGCSRNKIMIDTIIGFNEPTQRGLLVNITANALPYGDYFNGGVTVRPSSGLCNENQVIGGEFIAGSYAVNIQGGGYNKVTGTVCRQQNHRTYYVSNTAYGNTFNNNHCLSFLSSAIVFAYGAEDNEFSNNYCFSISAGGEAVVNINTGAKRNRVIDNYLYGRGLNYGVYMGCDAIGNEVEGNSIYWYYVAGIAIDSDWKSPRPTYAYYARPNYEAPPVGDRWAFNDSSGNIVANNKIYNADPARNVAAIALSQIDGLAGAVVRDTILDSNKILSPTGLAYNLSLYQESAGGILRTTLINNVFNSALSFLSADPSTTSATWNDKIEHFADNKKLDELLVAEPIALSAGTPSVANNSSVPTERLFALDASVTVTNFTGGYTGQEILIRLSAGSTITYGSGTIRTQGLTDITGRSANDFVKFKLLNGVWFEVFRSW